MRTKGITGRITYSHHFLMQAAAKGFTADQITEAVRRPEAVNDVLRYPGQRRYMGAGVAVVMDGNHAVTIYADKVVTPMREDQRSDPAAQNSRRLAHAGR